MITHEYILRKLSQKKQKKRFMHKVKYGREMEEKYGYDVKGHREEAKMMSTDRLIDDYFKN